MFGKRAQINSQLEIEQISISKDIRFDVKLAFAFLRMNLNSNLIDIYLFKPLVISLWESRDSRHHTASHTDIHLYDQHPSLMTTMYIDSLIRRRSSNTLFGRNPSSFIYPSSRLSAAGDGSSAEVRLRSDSYYSLGTT